MDGAIHMALSGKIDDRIWLVMVQQLADKQRIPNIAPDKNMLGIPIKRRQITDVAGIGELVEVDDPLPRSAPGQHIAGTDKPRASGYKNCLHSDTFQTRLGNTSNARNGLIAGRTEESAFPR